MLYFHHNFFLPEMEFCEALAELIGNAGAVDELIRTASVPVKHPILRKCEGGKTDLVTEDVVIPLRSGRAITNILTWIASFPVFHQCLSHKAKQFSAVLYRYGLGIEGGQRLSVKAANAMKSLLGDI